MKSMAKPAAAALLLATLAQIGPAAAQQRPAAAPTATASTPERGIAVRRTTLLVEDIDRSIDFYQRLGLTKGSDRTTQESDAGGVLGAADLPLTADPKTGRLVVMRGPDERLGSIGLLGYDKPRLPSARGNLGGLGSGDIIIVVEVPDIGEAYRRLGQIGTRFHRTPYRFTVTNPDGSQQNGQRMYAFDPDGHLVEVLQQDARK